MGKSSDGPRWTDLDMYGLAPVVCILIQPQPVRDINRLLADPRPQAGTMLQIAEIAGLRRFSWINGGMTLRAVDRILDEMPTKRFSGAGRVELFGRSAHERYPETTILMTGTSCVTVG